jgi:putative ABC transport system permease protein
MAQSVRERTNELAVLKALGFSDPKILMLVLAESLTLAGAGGGLGLLIGWLLIRQGDPTGGKLPVFHFRSDDIATGAALVLFVAVAVGVVPAVQALRLRIVDALRRA